MGGVELRVVVAMALIVGPVMAFPAAAADYYLISSNSNQIAVIDADAITPNQHGVTVPMVAIRRAARTGGISFAYAVVQSDFDCTNRQVAGMSVTIFNMDGRQSAEQPRSGGAVVWQPVNPGTQAESAWQFACAKPEQRASTGYRLAGLPLDRIVAGIFDGTWPYDEVLTHLPSSPTKP